MLIYHVNIRTGNLFKLGFIIIIIIIIKLPKLNKIIDI